MKVVKVDGTVFLADVADHKLTNAMALRQGNLGSDVGYSVFGDYVQASNVGELVEMEFGSTSAFASRDLNVMEKHALGNAEFAMGTAKEMAVRDLENQYFDRIHSGK